MTNQPTPPDYNQKFDQLSQMIADSNKLLERLATRPLDASKTRTESLTLNTNPVTFSSLGYSFYAIFAKSSFAMHVKQRGLTYDIALVPGFNQVYLLEMAELTADVNQQITMMWSAYPFSADANANQTSTVAVSGTPSVTLTGSNVQDTQAIPIRKKLPVLTTAVTNFTVTAGSEQIVRANNSPSNIDTYTFLATCATAHNFQIRAIQRFASSTTDTNAWTSDTVAGSSTVNSINRTSIKATFSVEYRVKNLDTVDHVYNAYTEEWYL